MRVSGTCFCKAFKFTASQSPQAVTACNCSFCEKRSALWATYKFDEVEFSVNGKGTWESEVGSKHNFCAACGCTTYSETPTFEPAEGADPNDLSSYAPNPDKMQMVINVRLIDDFDWRALPVQPLDGKNLW